MIVREDRLILAPPAAVWSVLENPVNMTLWNPKCVACDANGALVHPGLEFIASFKLSGPAKSCLCKVTECAPPCKLVVRQFFDDGKIRGHVDETMVLVERANGTQTYLRHTVDLRSSGLPQWVLWLMQVFLWVGRGKGPSSMEGIKALAEAAARGQTW